MPFTCNSLKLKANKDYITTYYKPHFNKLTKPNFLIENLFFPHPLPLLPEIYIFFYAFVVPNFMYIGYIIDSRTD